MTVKTWALFVITVFLLSATPGPNMMLALSHGVRFGARKAVATAIGAVSALTLLQVVSVTGLGALLAASVTAFEIVKWAGVVYLLFLGVKAWRAEPVGPHLAEDGAAAPADGAPWRLALQAFIVAVSNPKAIVFLVALFPQFLTPGKPLAPQLAILATSFGVCEFLWIMTYASGGRRLLAWLQGRGAARGINRLSGGVLLGAGAVLAAMHR